MKIKNTNVTKKGIFKLFLLMLFISCDSSIELKNESEDQAISINDKLRNDILSQNSSLYLQRQALLNISSEERNKVWLSKLNNLSNQVFPENIQQNINELKKLISDENDIENLKMNKQFRSIVINLETDIPPIHLSMMFEIIDDYKYDGFKMNGTEIKDFIKSIDLYNIDRKGACTCLWTCFLYEDSDNNCEETDEGCGFFLIQACTGTPNLS